MYQIPAMYPLLYVELSHQPTGMKHLLRDKDGLILSNTAAVKLKSGVFGYRRYSEVSLL